MACPGCHGSAFRNPFGAGVSLISPTGPNPAPCAQKSPHACTHGDHFIREHSESLLQRTQVLRVCSGRQIVVQHRNQELSYSCVMAAQMDLVHAA